MPATHSDSMFHHFPTEAMLMAFGTINLVWAQLDFALTGCLCSVLDIDSVEVGIVVGKIEVEAKFHKIKKILVHRKEITKANKVDSMRKIVEKLRPTRNAITHGVYIGSLDGSNMVFSIPTEFLVGDGMKSANAMRTVTFIEVKDHIDSLLTILKDLKEEFKGPRIDELLSRPIREPSYSPSKTPRQPQGKNPK